MAFTFTRTFGQNEARERLSQALAQGRFPHAMLVHGEPGLGQHALLLDLAQILVCESTKDRACGKCFSCKAFQSSCLESVHYLIPLVKKDKEKDKDSEDAETSMNSDQIEELSKAIQSWHAAPYAFSVPGKASVRVPQVRELIGRLGYARNRGARIVLVPYLESLTTEASNALLKTLEEPPMDVYFLIASENRAMLLPTLLSRCLHLGLSPLPLKEFKETASILSEKVGRPLSSHLLPFSEGSPGVYLDLLEHGGDELLEVVYNRWRP